MIRWLKIIDTPNESHNAGIDNEEEDDEAHYNLVSANDEAWEESESAPAIGWMHKLDQK